MVESREAIVMLNILSSYKKETMPVLARDYHRYFSPSSVPVLRSVKNIEGDILAVVIDVKQGIEYLKQQYGFSRTEEVVNGSHSDLRGGVQDKPEV